MVVNAAYVILVVVNVEWIFSLIPDGERFYPAIPVVVWTLARKYINAAFGSNGEIIANSPFYQLNMQIGSVMLVINVLLNLLFIPALRHFRCCLQWVDCRDFSSMDHAGRHDLP